MIIKSRKFRVSVIWNAVHTSIACMIIISSTAQNLRPLSLEDKTQIQKNIMGSPEWDRLNQLTMLSNNFPSMAGYYEAEINQIYDRNRFTLNTLTALKEDNQWQQQQQNFQHAQTFNQTLAPTQNDILALQEQQFQGNPPQLTKQEQQMADLVKILTEISTLNHSAAQSGWYELPSFQNDYATYQEVLKQLKDMLTIDNKSISLAYAMYLVESTYGNLHLSYEEYTNIIDQSAAFMKQWMKENNLDLNNPEAIHYTIQTFMGETMTIQNNVIKGIGTLPHSHKPFMYDYIDFRAVEDYRNYFLTKTLATGSGQCNTLPRVYLVLAEAMNVDAYLSFAPNHSFIKYKNNNGTIQNYETTIHWHMTDKDYMEQMPITMTAIKNHLYLDTLNKKQIIASLIVDLATTFMREHWLYDGSFVNECIDHSLQYCLNSEGLLLKSLVLASQLEHALAQAGITELNKIEPNTEAWRLYNTWQDSEAEIEALGIQAFPDDSYQQMLQKHDQRGRLQQFQGTDTKTKKSLFFD